MNVNYFIHSIFLFIYQLVSAFILAAPVSTESVCHCFFPCQKFIDITDGRKVNCCAMKILLAPQSHKAFLFHFVLFYFCKVAFLCDLWYLRNASYGMPFTLQLYYYRPFTPRTLLSGFCPYFIFGLNDYLID